MREFWTLTVALVLVCAGAMAALILQEPGATAEPPPAMCGTLVCPPPGITTSTTGALP